MAVKEKSSKIVRFVILLSLFSGSMAITSDIFLKSYNNSLIVQKQNVERKIDDLKKKNDNCKNELVILSGNDRIKKAAGKGMSYKPERITVIQDTEKKAK